MSSYQIPSSDVRGLSPADAGGAQPPGRPKTLTAVIVAATAVVVSALASALVYLVSGRDLLRSYIEESFDIEAGTKTGSFVLEAATEEAYGALQARAYLWIFLAAMIGLLLLAVRSARTWARVTLTVFSVIALFLGLRELADLVATHIGVLALVTVLAAATVVVACWLPPTNRFAKARKRR
ncbi:hypothetical protein [Thermoactinospora rubra]|uniref:hypothetical protein n=1 Tax=Thermoactinospora rubra TaxID=1088767 RepID=UPI000A114D3E|nr:hypothetical protein [Thermoactinospora rubra]